MTPGNELLKPPVLSMWFPCSTLADSETGKLPSIMAPPTLCCVGLYPYEELMNPEANSELCREMIRLFAKTGC